MQVPLTQFLPPEQDRPQPPQFWAEVLVLVSQPAAAVQLAKPALQM